MLSKLVSVHGSPKYLRSDNGPEFVSRAVLKWLTAGATSTPRTSIRESLGRTASNESFNGKFRDECLCMEWFRNQNRCEDHRSNSSGVSTTRFDLTRVSGN